MQKILEDGRKCWSEEEIAFLSDPKNLSTPGLHEAARGLAVAQETNFLIGCILNDVSPVTGGSISGQEDRFQMKGQAYKDSAEPGIW